MAVAKQLFELQETDLQIEARNKAVKQMTVELGENDVLRGARNASAEEQKKLEGLLAEQRSLDWEIDDISAKLNGLEKDLYSGRIKIHKELTNLQQEIANLKGRRVQLEDKVLVLMEQTESSRTSVSELTNRQKIVEGDWQSKQDELKHTIEADTLLLAGLVRKRQELDKVIDESVMQLYQTLRERRGTAVAKVEQGICRGCRVSLPAREVQNARSGHLVQCSNCGRILYLP
jgi:predicted  nucleic acid-binding Zn-ribbon protein